MKRIISPGCSQFKFAGLLTSLVLTVSGATLAQQPGKPIQDSKQTAKDTKNVTKPGYVLNVSSTPILNLSLKAEKASMVEIAADLSKRLKVPVSVGPTLAKESISIEYKQLPFEAAIQLMAPSVYVDYEIQTGSTNPPRPLNVFLFDANQGEPPLTASASGSTQSILVEGDTEDGVEPKTDDEKKKIEEQPLRITFRDGTLSVKAKQQPLVLVLLKIGEELGIQVEIQSQTNEVIDTEFSKLSVEDALRRLSPNIRLFLRADLTRSERRALRLVLAEPATSTQQGF